MSEYDETSMFGVFKKLGRLVDIPAGFPPPTQKKHPQKQNVEMSKKERHTKSICSKKLNRDLMGFASSFVHRAPFWTRFGKTKICRGTILYYSILFPAIPLHVASRVDGKLLFDILGVKRQPSVSILDQNRGGFAKH